MGALAFAFGVVCAGPEPAALILAGLAGVATGLFVRHRSGPTWSGSAAAQAPMTIVPWGVVVRSESSYRVLHWPAIAALTVDFVHEMDHATPSTRWSVVTIRTGRDVLGGRASGHVPLEGLQARLAEYSAQASRSVALDPWGRDRVECAGEPCVEALLDRSHRLLHSGALFDDLALSARGYRGACGVSRRSLERLEELLTCEPDGSDPRPLAAILAAELDARALCDHVAALALSPHPVLAAVSRVAALRLGADVCRVGALDELEEFLPAVDIDALAVWGSVAAANEGSLAADGPSSALALRSGISAPSAA
jgi:hypothetical protein